MRVALTSPLFESVPPRLYGGTERVVYNLCCGLMKAGIDVTLFASADSRAPCKVVPIVNEALRLANPPPYDPHVYNFKKLVEIQKRTREFDIIHNNDEYWMLPLTELTPTPVLTTLHGRLDLPVLPEILTSYSRAHFVSISNSQRAPLPNLNWVRTIYHGIDITRFRYRDSPGKYLAFLGRIHPEKRPDWAIQIARQAGVPLKIAAKIEGQAGLDYFNARVKPELKDPLIEFVGEITEDEKSDFLGNALALVFPIDWPEPFGLVMIESLACGTPVLARPFGSVPEILRDGITGFMRSDIVELAELVPATSRLNRRVCREWATQNFSLERMTEDYIHVYRFLTQFHNRRIEGRYFSDHDRWDLLHSVECRTHRNS